MASLPQSPNLEPPSHMNFQSLISLAPSTPEPGHGKPVGPRDSSLLQHRKSRIPRILSPSPKPSTKPKPIESKPFPVILKKPAPVQTSKLVPKTESKSTPEQQRVEPATKSLQSQLMPDLRQALNSSPPIATAVLKPVMTSTTPAKATGIKDVTKPERPPRPISDARKVKRMITGVAPLDAVVDCSAAPDWTADPPTATPSCVPRPHNLHITRRVGVDGVVIAWDPLEHDCVAGFQVLVGGRVVQHVRSPHRTKALVTALPLAGSFTVGLVAVAGDGRCSAPALVTQDRTRVYPGRAAVQRPLRRAVPTAL